MNKQIITVPKGIKYLTEWEDFYLPDHPCIIDKKLTGCGFTEYVIRSPFNSVLISPRKALLENKAAQHNPKIRQEDGTLIDDILNRNLYYARTDQPDLQIDKDLQSTKPKPSEEVPDLVDVETFKNNLRKAIDQFIAQGKPIKIEVTYDSFRKVREVLEKEYSGLFPYFYFIVDEMQAIFTDSRFKSGTELEFVTAIQGIDKVSFVSATPMMEEYLDLVDEFKNLPYYELDWETEEPSRVMSPEIIARPTRSINETAKKIINDFKSGKYQKKALIDNNGIPIKVVESTELIFYVNSVKNICDIIRQNKLKFDDVSVICADTTDNRKKIRDTFMKVYRELGIKTSEVPKEKDIISNVPTPDPFTGKVENKPITLCTKTVYLGADFYSYCARSIVLSDANIECLAVDITLDLPQIVGRQRLDHNPWKNSLEIWFKSGMGAGDVSPEKFQEIIDSKVETTKNLLLSYDSSPTVASKNDLAKKYLKGIKIENYRDDYVAVNQHASSTMIPQFNNLVMIAEKRAYDIQALDYKDRFTVFNRLTEVFGQGVTDISEEVQTMLNDINSQRFFTGKMKKCCEYVREKGDYWINFLDDPYRTYIHSLGIDFIISVGCQKSRLDEALVKRGEKRILSKEDLDEVILEYFQIGEKYMNTYIKLTLQEIYDKLGIAGKAKATDIENWFNVKQIRITNKETGKRDLGYEIIEVK